MTYTFFPAKKCISHKHDQWVDILLRYNASPQKNNFSKKSITNENQIHETQITTFYSFYQTSFLKSKNFN